MPSVDILHNVKEDSSGLVRSQSLDSLLTMTNAKRSKAYVFPSPVSVDYSIEGSFVVPADYASTPKIVLKGILDGTPTGTMAFAYADNPLADSEAADAAYGTEDTASNATWTGYVDKDVYVEEITLAGTYAAGDQVLYKLARDASAEQAAADAFAGRYLLTSARFDYSIT